HAEAWLGGRRSLAVAVMTIALLLILLVPFYFGVTAIVENVGRIGDWSKSLATFTVPPPPTWITTLPLIGSPIPPPRPPVAAATPEQLGPPLAPFAGGVAVWFVAKVGSLGLPPVQLLLTVVVVAILSSNGETAVRGVARFARRLAGPLGENAVHLAGRAVRAV